jgi:hypothetical protein
MTSNALLGPAVPPPIGGLDDLKSRIRRRRRRRAGVISLAALVVAVPLFVQRPEMPHMQSPADVSIDGGAAVEWPSSEPDVRIYLVAQLEASDSASRSSDPSPNGR